jgi:hypothetical protein
LHHPDDDNGLKRWMQRKSGSIVLPKIVHHHRRWESIELNVPPSLVCLRDLAKTIPTHGLPHLTDLLLGSVQTDWVRISMRTSIQRILSLSSPMHLTFEVSTSSLQSCAGLTNGRLGSSKL